MKPDTRFLNQPKHFWANVRTISQQIGYTDKKTAQIRVPTLAEMTQALSDIGLQTNHLTDRDQPTHFGQALLTYFQYRALQLNTFVEPHLMDVKRAKHEFTQLRRALSPQCPIPMNKQKGKMKAPAYFTGIINMLIEANAGGLPCDYNPQQLTTFTRSGLPLRTLARRIDGAFPNPINPAAVWEIKEYYYTTTFGSRVADGVYETLLDGVELEELRTHEHITVKHYLMIDAHDTWWNMGRSYLCRILDLLHMGYVDEVLFGYEVIERLPALVKEWVALVHSRA